MLLRCSILLSSLDMENTRAKKESSERLREQGMCVAAMKMERRLCHHPNFLVSVWTRAYYTEVQSDPSENKHINLRNRKKIIIPAKIRCLYITSNWFCERAYSVEFIPE